MRFTPNLCLEKPEPPQDDIRVSRARVSPLMREHGLLSHHRQPQKPPNAHDGRMTTDRPNEMWGTDGAKIKTVDEGLVSIFAAVDHCDAACVGIHTSPRWATALPHWSQSAKGCASSSDRSTLMPAADCPCE
ncbi:MAG: hypothetical protein VB137_15540 [Burkholderia sp.]